MTAKATTTTTLIRAGQPDLTITVRRVATHAIVATKPDGSLAWNITKDERNARAWARAWTANGYDTIHILPIIDGLVHADE